MDAGAFAAYDASFTSLMETAGFFGAVFDGNPRWLEIQEGLKSDGWWGPHGRE